MDKQTAFKLRLETHENYKEKVIARIRDMGYNIIEINIAMRAQDRKLLSSTYYHNEISRFLRYLPDAILVKSLNLYAFDIKSESKKYKNIAIELASLNQYHKMTRMLAPKSFFLVVSEFRCCWIEDIKISRLYSSISKLCSSKREESALLPHLNVHAGSGCSFAIIDEDKTILTPLNQFIEELGESCHRLNY